MTLRNYIKHVLIFCLFCFFILFSNVFKMSAAEIDWIEVDKTINGIQFIDANSIKYNNRGVLSVTVKYSQLNPEDQGIIGTNSYLMAIDCENRLFSKLPVNTELKQVKNWEEPTNDRLIKKTIIDSCSY